MGSVHRHVGIYTGYVIRHSVPFGRRFCPGMVVLLVDGDYTPLSGTVLPGDEKAVS